MSVHEKYVSEACVLDYTVPLGSFTTSVLCPGTEYTGTHILGLPFIVFYDFTIIGLHIVLLFICKKYVWDPFDAVDVKKGDSDK